MKTVALVLLGLFAVSLPMGPPAQAAPGAVMVEAIFLQHLPGEEASQARAINDKGEIVGRSGGQAVKWVYGTPTALPAAPQTSESLSALGLNNAGTVVGRDAFEQLCVWDDPGEASCYGTPWGYAGYAVGVNDAGLVVGSTDDEVAERGWFWDRANGGEVTVVEPALYPGSDISRSGTSVAAVNANGQFVGTTYSDMEDGDAPTVINAFVWTNDSMVVLETPEGSGSAASDLNDDGVVVGSIDAVAAMWVEGQAQTLGTLGGDISAARAINNLGQVAGISHAGDSDSHVFLWEDGVMRRLETDSGPVLGQVYDMNDHGQLVGESWDGDRWTATLWTLTPPPVEEPSADDPPADDPPAEDRPAEDPPADDVPRVDDEPSPDPSPVAVEPDQRSTAFDGNPATTGRIEADSAGGQAVAISRARFADDGASHVVLSRDDLFADSLAGTSLLRDGPMLLVTPDGLPSETSAELARALPAGGRVYLLGGSEAISVLVEDQLVHLGYDVQRLAGASRVETSVAVARETLRVNPDAPDVVIARADAPSSNPTAAWADSVTGGGWAAWTRSPIVLTPGAGLHPAVATFISSMEPSRTVLLGGTAALSEQVEASVPNPQRMAGANRAETAALIARNLWQHEPDHFVVINGYQRDGWAYGLPAAGLSADAQAPLLVAEVGSVPPETIGQVSTPCGDGARVDTLLVGASPQLSVEVALLLDGVDGGACSAP